MNTKGFTLVELVVAILIIGIIGGLAVPNIIGYVEKSRINADIADATQLVKMAGIVYAENPKFSITAIRQAVQEKLQGDWPKGRTSAADGAEMDLLIDSDEPRTYKVEVNGKIILPANLANEPYKKDDND